MLKFKRFKGVNSCEESSFCLMLLRIATVAWMVLVMDPVVLLFIHKQSLSLCLFKEFLEHDKGPIKPKGRGRVIML
jgi:hypothetical protein